MRKRKAKQPLDRDNRILHGLYVHGLVCSQRPKLNEGMSDRYLQNANILLLKNTKVSMLGSGMFYVELNTFSLYLYDNLPKMFAHAWVHDKVARRMMLCHVCYSSYTHLPTLSLQSFVVWRAVLANLNRLSALHGFLLGAHQQKRRTSKYPTLPWSAITCWSHVRPKPMSLRKW